MTTSGTTGHGVEAARRADVRQDTAIKLAACRAILREAGARCAQIAFGVTVLGAEEIVFSDMLERSMAVYQEGKSNPASTRAFIGATRGLDEIENRVEALTSGEES